MNQNDQPKRRKTLQNKKSRSTGSSSGSSRDSLPEVGALSTTCTGVTTSTSTSAVSISSTAPLASKKASLSDTRGKTGGAGGHGTTVNGSNRPGMKLKPSLKSSYNGTSSSQQTSTTKVEKTKAQGQSNPSTTHRQRSDITNGRPSSGHFKNKQTNQKNKISRSQNDIRIKNGSGDAVSVTSANIKRPSSTDELRLDLSKSSIQSSQSQRPSRKVSLLNPSHDSAFPSQVTKAFPFYITGKPAFLYVSLDIEIPDLSP